MNRRLGIWGLGLVMLGSCLFLAGMPFDSDYQWADYHGWGTGGLNLFSTSDNLDKTQALYMVNLLFEGSHVRARKGVVKMNTASLGGREISGVYQFQKSAGFSQILAVYRGQLYEWDNLDSSLTSVQSFLWDTVGATQNDTTIIGDADSRFTLLGYEDSITIHLNDTTYYVRQITCDSVLYLYSVFRPTTDATTEIKSGIEFPIDRPTVFNTWMDNVYIVGTKRLVEWDGATISGDIGDTTTYEITAVDTSSCDVNYKGTLKITVTPTFTNQGYGWNDLEGYYIVSYNDTSANSKLNKPFRIQQQWGDYCYVQTGYLNFELRHFGGVGQQFKIAPPLTSKKLVHAGLADSVANRRVCPSGGFAYSVVSIIYDDSQVWDTTSLDFGAYTLYEPSTDTWTTATMRIWIDGNGNDALRYYSFYSDTTFSEGDSFEVYRLEGSKLEDIPQYIAHWMDCQWQAGFGDDPNLIIWSEAFDPDSFPALNFVYVDRDDGDIITALVVMSFQDYLLVFKKKHISAITVSDGDDILGSMWVNDLVDGIGTPAWASIISYGRNVYFYDYSGWYVLNGIEPVKISWAIEDITVDSVNRDYAHLIVGGYFDKHLWWSYPSGSSTKNNRTVLFNLETNKWTHTDLNLASIYVGLDENAENGILLGSPDSGVVWTYGGTYFDDGNSITATYLSGWFGMDDGYESNKEFKDFQLLLDKHDSTQIYIEMFKDYSSTAFTKDTIGVDNYDVLKYRKRTIEDDNLGQRIQVSMTITRIDGDFQLPFFKIKWRPIDEVLYDTD